MTESEFQGAVIDAARLYGWKVFHAMPAPGRDGVWRTHFHGDRGFPDLVLVHPKRGLVFAELKSAKGRPTEDQIIWLDALNPWAPTYMWRPADWDQIVKVLSK